MPKGSVVAVAAGTVCKELRIARAEDDDEVCLKDSPTVMRIAIARRREGRLWDI